MHFAEEHCSGWNMVILMLIKHSLPDFRVITSLDGKDSSGLAEGVISIYINIHCTSLNINCSTALQQP